MQALGSSPLCARAHCEAGPGDSRLEWAQGGAALGAARQSLKSNRRVTSEPLAALLDANPRPARAALASAL